MMTTLLLQYQLLKTGGRTMDEHGNIIIYKDKNGNDNIEVKLQDNTVWLNQEQLVRLYNSSKSSLKTAFVNSSLILFTCLYFTK